MPRHIASISGITQPFCLDGSFADIEHAAGIAVIRLFDGGDVNIKDVAILKFFFTRHAMAYLMID